LRDVLCRGRDYPWLTLHLGLLDDLEFPAGPQRESLERRVFLAMFYTFAALHLQESILQAKGFDGSFALLAQSLSQQACWQLAQLGPGSHSLWTQYQAFWRSCVEAILWDADRSPAQDLPAEPEALLCTSDRLAPGKTGIVAVALLAGRKADLPELLSLLDHLNTVLQVRKEIADVRRDLIRGRLTYPIAKTMQVAGIPNDASTRPEQVLGAMVLTDAIDRICQECETHLDAGTEIAQRQNLPTFQAYLAVVRATIREIQAVLSVKPFASGALAQVGTRAARSRSRGSSVSRACEMAEGYLLSDLTFQESWEVHRWGMFDVPELVSKQPSSLVIEVLCKHGHDMADQVDATYRDAEGAQFRYYDHRYSIPDADTLGALLRLHRYSRHKSAHAVILRTPLAWMEANVLDSGQIPVWLTNQIVEGEVRPPTVDVGGDCGVVEAHLLLGLIDYDWAHYRDVIVNAATYLLGRLVDQDYALTVNYPPLYMLAIMQRLIAELLARRIPTCLDQRIQQAAEYVVARLEREAQRQRLTPQDAAFLVLACRHPSTRSLLEPRWVNTLVEGQRHDGGWAGHPFFFVPDRDGALACYTSRTMTTAFCYDALKILGVYIG
jgi:hypothetical protein